MSEKVTGKVEKFFAKPSVAAVKVESGSIKVGDTIRIRGATTDFTQKVESMEVEHEQVQEATPGALVGIKTIDRVRPGDTVEVVTDEE